MTYASLTTARLGLRTAALIGADAVAAHAREIEMLRDAGVLVSIIEVASSPVFHNLETPEGRRQTCLEPGTPLGVVDLPDAWRDARAWSFAPVAGEVRDDWVAVVPDDAYVVVGWQGFLRELVPGEPVRRADPGLVPVGGRLVRPKSARAADIAIEDLPDMERDAEAKFVDRSAVMAIGQGMNSRPALARRVQRPPACRCRIGLRIADREIASRPSPMNLRTSPPCAWMTGTWQSK